MPLLRPESRVTSLLHEDDASVARRLIHWHDLGPTANHHRIVTATISETDFE